MEGKAPREFRFRQMKLACLNTGKGSTDLGLAGGIAITKYLIRLAASVGFERRFTGFGWFMMFFHRFVYHLEIESCHTILILIVSANRKAITISKNNGLSVWTTLTQYGLPITFRAVGTIKAAMM